MTAAVRADIYNDAAIPLHAVACQHHLTCPEGSPVMYLLQKSEGYRICSGRLEPLIVCGAEKRRPVYAAYYKGGRRLHVGLAVRPCSCISQSILW